MDFGYKSLRDLNDYFRNPKGKNISDILAMYSKERADRIKSMFNKINNVKQQRST